MPFHARLVGVWCWRLSGARAGGREGDERGLASERGGARQELETRTHPSELLAKAPQQKPRRQSVARTSSAGAGTGKDAAADEKLSLVGSLRKSLDVLGAEEALGGGHPWLRGGGRNSAGTLMGVTLGRGESDVSAGMTDATSFSRASSSGLTARRLSKVLKAPVEVKAGHRTDGKPFKIPAAMRLQLAVEEVCPNLLLACQPIN